MIIIDTTKHDYLCEGIKANLAYGCGCRYRYETNIERKIKISGMPDWLANIYRKIAFYRLTL